MTQNIRMQAENKLHAEICPTEPVKESATHRTGKIEDFFGVLAGKTSKVATLEEIQEATERGWAGLVDVGE